MAAGGTLAVATTDPRLVAVTGERAAWNDRTPDSWEHVMPYGVRTDQQRRLVAAGYAVRVSIKDVTK
jgi:proline dehydrogenase